MNELAKKFKEVFKVNHDSSYFSPGRVNLIGEHTDYNGGYVFPFAISLGTTALVSKRDDLLVRLYSDPFSNDLVDEFNINSFEKSSSGSWLNYVKGVIYYLKEKGFTLNHGFNAYITSTMPKASGLSSSASLEMLICIICKDLFFLDIDTIELVKIAQLAENKYVGVNSGIMDQFACGMGLENHAILLDAKSLEYHYYPVNLGDASVIVVNTNKPRKLVESKYNERVFECQSALKKLNSAGYEIEHLCDLPYDHLVDASNILTENEFKRVRHLVSETKRTVMAANALEENRIKDLGVLLNSSHESLRDDYEVTGIELDTIYDAAKDLAYGVRMTGAGFGGCAIILAPNDKILEIKQHVTNMYYENMKYYPSFYEVKIVDGTKKIMEEKR